MGYERGLVWRAILIAHVLMLAVAFTGTVAQAQSAEDVARGHYTLARAQYEAGQFDDAAREFQAAYDAAPRPQLLYNIYLAHRDGGHAEPAATALRGYVATLEDGPTKTQLAARLRALERVVAEQAQAHTEGPADGVAEPPVHAPPAPVFHETVSDETSSTANSTDEPPAGDARDITPTAPTSTPWVVVGVGAGVALAGAVVGGFALRAQNDLEETCPDPAACEPGTWRGTRDRGRRLAISADALWIGGAAIGVAGLLWVLLRSPAENPRASAICSGDGCALSVRGSF